MATENKILLKKLNEIRIKTLPRFQKIKLTPQAVGCASKLFLHPFCVATRDLKKFIHHKPVKLAALSRYVLTAFPNTISYYAQERKKILIDAKDILECFALDHIAGIAENKIEKIYSPSYALSHILTLTHAQKLHQHKNYLLADLRYCLKNRAITFKNVFVPKDSKIKKGDRVFHHFGVVIDYVQNKNLADLFPKLKSEQKQEKYLSQILPGVSSIIDFGKSGLYPFDLTRRIIKKNQHQDQKQKIKLNLNTKKRIPFSR